MPNLSSTPASIPDASETGMRPIRRSNTPEKPAITIFVAGGNANGNERRSLWRLFDGDDDIKVILAVNPINDDEGEDKKYS